MKENFDVKDNPYLIFFNNIVQLASRKLSF